MSIDTLRNEYFEWLYTTVTTQRYSSASPHTSYRKLLIYLHNTEFTYHMRADADRADDGIQLRYRFDSDYVDSRPCSMLEMMVALAIDAEECIMDDPKIGNRTNQWFWGMINSLGLGGMVDSRFDRDYVNSVIERFLDRNYEPDGRGGLVTLRNCNYDLREVDIWTQVGWYLNKILGY